MKPTDFAAKASSEEPDWTREEIRFFWDTGRKLLRSIRRYQSCQARKGIFWGIAQRYWVINHWFWSLVTQCEIPLNSDIGGGLFIPHPNGIVVHPDSRIGPITIGEHVRIGANAVVTKDIPAYSVAAGVPAKVTQTDLD